MPHDAKPDLVPDLVIVGDSHSAALYEAAAARGLDARMLYISGNHWHDGLVRWHRLRGLDAPANRRLRAQILRFAQDQGGSVFPRNVPILACFGYHLGRLTGPFQRHGHDTDPAGEGSFVSPAFLRGYVMAQRRHLVENLRRAARLRDLTVIAPPVVQAVPVAQAMAGVLTDAMLAAGLRVFDPRRTAGFEGLLPDDQRSDDTVHGNVVYGGRVLDAVLGPRLIRLAA